MTAEMHALPTAVPEPRPAPESRAVRVVVTAEGRSSLSSLLADLLPPGWSVAPSGDGDPGGVDFVVLSDPGAPAVRTAATTYPDADVVVVLGRRAPVSAVVEATEAGAAACIREPTAALVAGYLARLHAVRLRRARR